METNNQQFGSTNDNPPRRVDEVNNSINEHLDKLTSLVECHIVGKTQQAKACCICTSSGHSTNACPTLHEEHTMHANAVGRFSVPSQRGYGPFSNTYNPEWRDHLNLRYDDQPLNFQRPPYQQPPPPPQANPNSGMPLEDIVKTLALSTQRFQEETLVSIQNLESQVSQLASSVSHLEFQELQLENSTRSGHAQQNRTENSVVHGHAEQGKIGEELEIPPNQAENSELNQEEHIKVFVPRPPFPEQFAKSKKEEEDKEIIETLSKVEFLTEMCTNKSKLRGNERVIMGENVSTILQKKPPPKCKDPETWVVLQLADRSIVYPEGVLEDVLVQVKELVFLTEFYVINMMDNSPNSTSILLGKPFLKTSKIKINVDAGILSMEFDNEVVSFSIGGVTQNSNDMHSVFSLDPLVRENAMFDGGRAFKVKVNTKTTYS
ncbi:UNVERIFIED_CONTAM: hypothetical protein Sradi_4024300 [Sesamum radiatum]|uniref:Retrotransposon gag protein n=1 Tax=Sesamum radiatum TaxID=300843 RepID=A0AAW2PHZ6_SESRA